MEIKGRWFWSDSSGRKWRQQRTTDGGVQHFGWRIHPYVQVGNAAGTGARIALLNKAARNEIEELVKRIEKVETAVEPRFQEHFIGAIAIPHASEPFPNLAAMVDLPVPPAAGPAPAASQRSGPSRRRRRLARGKAS